MYEIEDSAKLMHKFFQKSQINILQSPIKNASFLYCWRAVGRYKETMFLALQSIFKLAHLQIFKSIYPC